MSKILILYVFYILSLLLTNKLITTLLINKPNTNVIYIWSGAVSPNSANVRVKISNDASVRLGVSTSLTFSTIIYGASQTVDASTNYMANLQISGLTKNTRYYYRLEIDGLLDNTTGSFLTTSNLPYSFNFVVSACAYDSDHVIYDKMGELNPDFYLNIGDFHYANPNSNDVNIHRNAYETNILSKTKAANFFKSNWFAYIWDDHDYCGNDSDSLSIGRESARQAYREYIPHFDLPAGAGDRAIYQAFTVGRIRFILTDLRSSRISGLTQMNASQNVWFKNEISKAKENKQMIFWVSPTSYSGDQPDNWGGFINERTELADYFNNQNIQNMMILCGDAHMLAIDNGNNSDFSTGNNNINKYPILQAAALNRPGSYKGGTFSEGYYPNPSSSDGQFAYIQITDNGGSNICINIDGIRTDINGNTSTVVTYNFCRELGTFSLPLHLIKFTGSYASHQTSSLNWFTLNEENVQGFEIEKSIDGQFFYSIGFQTASNFFQQNYTFTDERFTENSYYRLKIINMNGSIEFSKTIYVEFSESTVAQVYPNPLINNILKIKLSENIKSFDFELSTLNGQIVFNNRFINQKPECLLYLPHKMAAGMYAYKIKTLNKIYSGRIYIQ